MDCAIRIEPMAGLIEAIDIKRKMYFEFENAPYHCLDVDVSRPTARGGQTLVRLKMRNLLTRAVFDKTFKAGEKFREPDLEVVAASYLYADADGYHFMDQETFETLTLRPDTIGDDRQLLVDNVLVQIQKYNGCADRHAVPAARGADRRRRPSLASEAIRPAAASPNWRRSRPDSRFACRLFIKEGERVKVHTETREFAGRA